MNGGRKSWKIAYVCPRYLPGTAGGAEVLTRSWAERMAARGHISEVLTTCARDHITWENYYPPGEETVGGVTVRRFPVEPPDPATHRGYEQRILRAERLTREEEAAWLKSGVFSPALLDFIRERKDDYDCFIFTPYLFGVTYFGLLEVPEKAILVPCLHDEPTAYLRTTRELFLRAAAVFFNAPAERELALRIADFGSTPTAVIGLGVESPDQLDPDSFREKYQLDSPFVLYAGRRELLKNTRLLIEYFRAFCRHQSADLKLVLIGTGAVELGTEDRGKIVDLGYLPEEEKWNGYSAASVFCQPSNNESFSIVLLEAFAAGCPGLVSAFCPVTLDHCLRSAAGLFYRDYFEFEEALLLLARDRDLAAALGANGRRYVRDFFSWKDVLGRLEIALEKVFGGGQ